MALAATRMKPSAPRPRRPSSTPTGLFVDSSGIISIADSGNFTLRRALTTALFNSLVAPTIAVGGQPSSISIVQGANATFTVTLGTPAASPTPTIQWQRQAVGTTGFLNLTDGVAYSGSATATLTVTQPTTANSGDIFQVVISNTAGTVTSSTAVLTVVTPPTITAAPTSLSVVAGGVATFTVSATGTPAPTYQWYFNGTAITGATSTAYTISPVTAANAGSYTVLVSNSGGGSVLSAPATLTVTVAPAFDTSQAGGGQPISQSVGAGQSVTFTAAALGTPTPTFQWFFNNSPISGQTLSTLTLTNVQSANAGSYSVSITNSAGTVVSNPATLTVTQTVFAGNYFGTIGSSQGNWAMTIGSNNTGTFLAYLSATQSAIIQNVTVGAGGVFSTSGATVANVGSGQSQHALATGGVTYTLSGTIAGTSVNGSFGGSVGNLAITGTQDSVTGQDSTVQGYYTATAQLAGTGTIYAIIGASGKSLVVDVTPTAADDATGTANASGVLNTTTAAGANALLTFSGTGALTGLGDRGRNDDQLRRTVQHHDRHDPDRQSLGPRQRRHRKQHPGRRLCRRWHGHEARCWSAATVRPWPSLRSTWPARSRRRSSRSSIRADRRCTSTTGGAGSQPCRRHSPRCRPSRLRPIPWTRRFCSRSAPAPTPPK